MIIIFNILINLVFASSTLNFDHQHLLFKYFLKDTVEVHTGVNYSEFKKNTESLNNYLHTLRSVNIEEFNQFNNNQKQAYLINGHNACVLKLITSHYPLKSVTELSSTFFNIFDTYKCNLYKTFTLNSLEKLIKTFNPLNILTLYRASLSSPSLNIYSDTNFEIELKNHIKYFMNDKRLNEFIESKQKLDINPLFKEIGYSKQKMIDLWSQYVCENNCSQSLSNGMFIITYKSFDWRLNDKNK